MTFLIRDLTRGMLHLVEAGAILAACALLLLAAACASAPVGDWCPTSFDTWVEGGYGENRYKGRDEDYWGDVSNKSRGSGSDWSSRAGVSVHWDLTGSCWDYEVEEEGEGVIPNGPRPEGGGP